jgi:hypothetical protein
MTLGQYITALVASLRRCDPVAYARMCHVVGQRTARIQVDAEYVYIRMQDRTLQVETPVPEGSPVDGGGATDSATVLALLRGDLEVSEAILNETLVVDGDIEQINRMFVAIEILLDAAPRCPAMQKLSEQFVEDAPSYDASRVFPRVNWYPFAPSSAEFKLLTRYGLLPL